jgi:hypothetical protein
VLPHATRRHNAPQTGKEAAMNDQQRETGAVRELTQELKHLIPCVRDLVKEMKRLKESTIPDLVTTHTVHSEKIGRLELLVYGSFAALGVESITIVGLVIAWVVTR